MAAGRSVLTENPRVGAVRLARAKERADGPKKPGKSEAEPDKERGEARLQVNLRRKGVKIMT